MEGQVKSATDERRDRMGDLYGALVEAVEAYEAAVPGSYGEYVVVEHIANVARKVGYAADYILADMREDGDIR
jgi:hypothetical protein